VLDSSIVIALLDADDAGQASAVRALRDYHDEGREFLVPASVLAQVLVAESRRDGAAVDQRRQDIRTLFGPTRPIDDDVAVAAAALRAAHRSLRLPDALVIAVGLVEGADVVLTADKRWADVDDRVRVISG
jgi:predicted nucleic acid-binding protein